MKNEKQGCKAYVFMHIHRTESGFTSDVLTSLGAVCYNRAAGEESAGRSDDARGSVELP